MDLVAILLEEIKKSDGYQYEEYKENGMLLTPPEESSYYMPTIVINDLNDLENVLQDYINFIGKYPRQFYKFDDRHGVKNYLFYLIKSLSNTDCQDFTRYVRRFISYLKDINFDEFEYSQVIGKMNEYDISVRKCEEYYGSETPYTTHFYAETLGFKFEMPLIRYGISDENVAYIHSIQRKKLYNNKSCRIKKINCLFNTVNKGVKDNRDITPSMLCSLAIFMGMLRSNNITEIKSDGFLTRRYGHFNGITDDEERECISSNCVEKFIKLFMRISDQFEGIEITSFPFDIDSYIHIKIGDNVHSNNELLNTLYNVGFNFSKEGEKVKKK